LGITSRIYAKLVDIYFPGAFFSGITEQPGQNSELPDIEKYAKETETKWALDIQRMSCEKPFDWFFPSDKTNSNLTTSKWEGIDQRLRNQKPKDGGLPRPFVEMEDDKFIHLLNNASGQKFERKQDFSIPEDFYIVLEKLGIIVIYDYEKKMFVWDSMDLLINKFKPDSIYEAYQRYAHAEYTRLSFGIKESPLEKDIKKLRKFGNDKILYDLGPKIAWHLIEDALQVFPNGDPYKLGSLEEIKTDVKGQLKRAKQMGHLIFEHNDEVNISNAWKDLSSFITDKATSEKEKDEIKQAGLVMKVRLLYKFITDESERKKINPRRIDTIEALHRKLLIDRADFLDKTDDDNKKQADISYLISGESDESGSEGKDEKYKHDSDILYWDPEEIFLEKEGRRKFILSLFDNEFKGSKKFLDKVPDYIMDETVRHLNNEIYRYINPGKHNINGALFGLFCKANDMEPKSKEAMRFHSQFADKIEGIADKLYAYDTDYSDDKEII